MPHLPCRAACLLLLLLLLLLTACGQAPRPPLRIATNVWPGYEPLYLARELGYFDPRTVRLVEMGSSTEVLHELRNGTIDGAALTLDEALSAVAEGLPLVVVLVMDISAGADALVARPGLERLADLRGHRVGVETTAVGALLLESALQAGGLGLADITPVPLTADQHLPAWERGAVEALVTFEPMRSRLLEAGGHVLFDSRRIPGRIIDVLVIRRDRLPGHEEQLRSLVSAYFRALAYQHAQPARAARLMQPRLRLKQEEILAAFQGLRQPDAGANRRWLSGDPPLLERRARTLARFMAGHGLLPPGAPPPGISDQFLPPP